MSAFPAIAVVFASTAVLSAFVATDVCKVVTLACSDVIVPSAVVTRVVSASRADVSAFPAMAVVFASTAVLSALASTLVVRDVMLAVLASISPSCSVTVADRDVIAAAVGSTSPLSCHA